MHLVSQYWACVCSEASTVCIYNQIKINSLSISFQQLHSSVRTGNLETCLRLLSLGAQANFFHPVSLVQRAKKKPRLSWHNANASSLCVCGTTGEGKHPTTHSSQSRSDVTSRTIGSLWSWSWGSGLKWKDPHWLRKVKKLSIFLIQHLLIYTFVLLNDFRYGQWEVCMNTIQC